MDTGNQLPPTENEDDESYALSWAGTIGATLTVLVTTLDDSVWLLSFVGSASLSTEARVLHAITFLVTITALASVCCVLAVYVEKYVVSQTSLDKDIQAEEEALERILEWIAAVICWLLAIGIYVKGMLKRRRRRLRVQAQQEQHRLLSSGEESTTVYGSASGSSEGHAAEEQITPLSDESNEQERQNPTSSQPLTVVSLTALGFMDEISYFPTLVIGNIFSVAELLLGTFLAGMIMLGIPVFVASQCKPLIDYLDRHVPLYGIITAFAVILTVQALWGTLEDRE